MARRIDAIADADVAVLAIDQAKRSGYAVKYRGAIVSHGTALKSIERAEVLAIALRYSLHVLVVLEDHSKMPISRGTRSDRRGGKVVRSTATLIGIGKALGRWEERLDDVGHLPSMRLYVEPRVWRARVLGSQPESMRCGYARGLESLTDVWKARACLYASTLLRTPVPDDNAAEAICMAEWGALDGIAQWRAQGSAR